MFEHILHNIQSNLSKVKDTLLIGVHENNEMLRIVGKIEDNDHERRLYYIFSMITILVRVLIKEKMPEADTVSLTSITTIIPLDNGDDQELQQPVLEDLKKYMHDLYELTEFIFKANCALKQEVHENPIEYELYRLLAEVDTDIKLVLDNPKQSASDVEHNVNKVTPPSPPQRMIIDIENNDSELDDASITRLTNSADTVTPLKPLSYDNIRQVDSEESRKKIA